MPQLVCLPWLTGSSHFLQLLAIAQEYQARNCEEHQGCRSCEPCWCHLAKHAEHEKLSEIAMSAAAPVGSLPRGWELLADGVVPIDPCHLVRGCGPVFNTC